MKIAMLISSDDPFSEDYYPDGKWALFKERINSQGAALWGLNAGKPHKAEQCDWVYVHVKGKGTVQVRMRLVGFELYDEARALPEDPRRIPRFKDEAFRLFLEIDNLEVLRKPLDTFDDLKKLDGKKIGNAPQKFSYIIDPLEEQDYDGCLNSSSF